MEPSTKKRKLAPKVNAAPVPNPQPSQYPNETPQATQQQQQPPQQPQQQPPPPPPPPPPPQQQEQQPQQQRHAAHDAPPVAERHDFESFARHLQDAAMLIQRQTERPPYANVSVLLLSWQEDTSVDDDLAALERVLQKQYNYGTQRWQIPTVPNPSIKLGVQMASFLEHARPSHLLIIYYAGCGFVGPDNQLYWACNAREDAAKLKWGGVRCLFEDAQSDILLLLDTCAIPDSASAGSHGVKQALAARTPEQNPRDDTDRSFTANLAESFHKLSGGRAFSAQRLYEEVLSQKQHHSARGPRVPNGSSNSAARDQPPLFFTLTPGKGQNLTLAPLAPRPPPASQNGSDGSVANGHSMQGREDKLIDPDSVADLRFDEARILVCTTFVGDASPDMSFFNQWLQNTPPLGSKIAVEGMFLGPPTMLLISMPHSIWNVVQHDKVCCFLGYISSHNMIHLYERLVGPAGVRPSAKEVEDGRILLEARELAAGTPARMRREPDSHDHTYHSPVPRERLHDGRQDLAPQGSPSRTPYAPVGPASTTPITPKNEVEDSAEMQEAAEQLKALSHVRHRSDETVGPDQRPRTSLPDATPITVRDAVPHAHDAVRPESNDPEDTTTDPKLTPSSRAKAVRRSAIKPETRCNHCSHAPFKDSSSLRKHIAAAHTRPFPCAFSFAGCTSTFGSKNEWKRHIASQHLCLQYYRCSQCPQSAVEGKGNEFNRKDLFTQHLRRMHAPFQVKRAMSNGETKHLEEWEEHVKNMQQTCLMTRRQPPQRSACPKPGCQHAFDGPGSWDEWTEHVGRHMEKGEAQSLSVDGLLAQWALDEGIIEPKGNGEYRLCVSNIGGSQGSAAGMFERKDSSLMPLTDPSQMDSSHGDDVSMVDARPAISDVGEGLASAT